MSWTAPLSSDPAQPAYSRLDCWRMGAGLALVSLLFGWRAVSQTALTLEPWQAVQRMKRWEPVSCQIIASTMLPEQIDLGEWHRISVRYRYAFNGVSREGHRYSPFDQSIRQEGDKKLHAYVAAFPPGSWTTCFVNPDDPAEAVLSRELPGGWGSEVGLQLALSCGCALPGILSVLVCRGEFHLDYRPRIPVRRHSG